MARERTKLKPKLSLLNDKFAELLDWFKKTIFVDALPALCLDSKYYLNLDITLFSDISTYIKNLDC